MYDIEVDGVRVELPGLVPADPVADCDPEYDNCHHYLEFTGYQLPYPHDMDQFLIDLSTALPGV